MPLTAAVVTGLTVAAATAHAQTRSELDNVAKSGERGAITGTSAYQARLSAHTRRALANAVDVARRDPERQFLGGACWTAALICGGDPRLDDWAGRGYGEVRPVLFTARSGATLSGHMWRTRAGAKRKPLVVIDNGSFQAEEQAYWWAAQTLAKAGYVVMTFDPQTQGMSDTGGAPPDEAEGRSSQNDGAAFFDGVQDALDFALSTPAAPYRPRPSRTTQTSHADKQQRRVASGLNPAYNPLWQRIDAGRVGLAGHSAGSNGATWVGQADPRVDAVVAWDNLCVPTASPPTVSWVALSNPARAQTGLPPECIGGMPGPIPALTKPSLGIAGDYLFVPVPYLEAPDPTLKSQASLAYSRAGVDTGQIVIRGGTHEEFSWMPIPGGLATLRGIDLTAWYTTAWFDKYLKHDASADRRLLTDRWRDDAPGRAVDADRDGNLFSYHYRSRIDVRRADGTRVTCENLRTGCEALAPDGGPSPYTFIDVVLRGDGQPDRCVSRRAVVVTVAPRGSRIVRAAAHVGGRRLPSRRVGTRRLRVNLAGLPPQTVRVALTATLRRATDGRRTSIRVTRTFTTCGDPRTPRPSGASR